MHIPEKPIHNLLLAALPAEELVRIVPLLRPAPMVRKTIIYNVGDPIAYMYFPSGGLVAEVATLADGQGLSSVLSN